MMGYTRNSSTAPPPLATTTATSMTPPASYDDDDEQAVSIKAQTYPRTPLQITALLVVGSCSRYILV